jgi:transglutaminase-like putative cysteine protease/predicted glutamine amidotransferase
MPNLLAMSFEGELAPSLDLHCLQPGRKLPDGWGIGYYPGGEPSASVLKEPAPPEGSIRGELIKAWEHLASSIFVLHIRTATWGSISDANTQPFARSYGGRDWLLGHSGSLTHRVETIETSVFQPVGSTDTELLFCRLMTWIAAQGWRSIGDIDPLLLRKWFEDFNVHGSLTTVLTDGRDLCAYADIGDQGQMYLWQVTPPYERLIFGDTDVEIDLTKRGAKSRKGVLITSEPLEGRSETPAQWTQLPPGGLLVIRQGAVRANLVPPGKTTSVPAAPGAPPAEAPLPPLSTGFVLRPSRAEVRRLNVRHRTAYRYKQPVEKSTHLFRLMPTHDRLQSLLFHEMTISVNGQEREYEDVFGNQARRVLLDTPFTELVIDAWSRVELLDTDPLSFRPLHARSTIPLVWMPWQRHMLQPFLLPPELPESELVELVEYAMSFVHRNDYDLLDTLLDINWTIFKEYRYRQGSTTIFTTPFEVYADRQGVCQDFANLFICLSRLLGVPARYVCGYIYTGPKNPNQRQSEASHAWVQVYLPEVGWKGFDPTNGVLTQTDHVRVAVGRSYVDATPTSGTIFVGGGGETLEVDVRCESMDG